MLCVCVCVCVSEGEGRRGGGLSVLQDICGGPKVYVAVPRQDSMSPAIFLLDIPKQPTCMNPTYITQDSICS